MQLSKTKIISGKECREAIMYGVNTLADVVESSLGPRSAETGISRVDQQGNVYDRIILKDGVSIGRSVDLKDEKYNFSAQVLLEAAQKSVQEVGDGTTVTICMARALIVEAEKRIAAGIAPMAIKEEIEPDIKRAIELLKENAKPITTLEQKIQIATISCEEESLGKLIGQTIDKVGDEGVITVEHSKNGETYVDMQEGMQWDRGLASPYMITDADTLTGTIEDGYVLVTDFPINNILELKPLLDDFIKHSRFLTIIAPEFGGDGLSSLIANKLQNVFLTLAIKAPSFGRQQTDMLQDIAILTGATYITKDQGHKLTDVRFEHLGKAKKITGSLTSAILSGGEGKKEAIEARIAEVKKLLEGETNDFENERLRERLAKLTKGVAVIKVGGHTDIEIKERYERALDSTLATRQAVKKGIVAGGEVSYLPLIPYMKSEIVKKALEAPFKRLVTNAGKDAGRLLERLDQYKDPKMGYDVMHDRFVDMIENGIIDPVSCAISALTNASSVAIRLVSTQQIVVPEDKEVK